MERNIGGLDKKIRFVLGIVIIALGIYLGSWWGAIGVVLLATGLMNWCPIYAIFGISTSRLDVTGGRL